MTDFRGLRGLPEHALPFKNLDDALYLRNQLIRSLEEAAIERHDALLRKQLSTYLLFDLQPSVRAELEAIVRELAAKASS